MKGNQGKIRGKKVLSMVLAVTLSMSPIASMGNVEAEETQNANVLNVGEETENTNVAYIDEETSDLDALAGSGESVEDKKYVVYIEVTDEVQSTAGEDNSNAVSEDADTASQSVDENADAAGQLDSENVLSEMTVSENVMSKEAVITNEDKMTEFGIINNDSKKTAEDIQESIEEAEELIIKQAEGQELVKDEETIIYAADLTQKEIETLEESDVTIYVEENIELFGAKSKSDKKDGQKGKANKVSHKSGENELEHKKSDNKVKDDAEEKQQESSEMKEKKLAYKKSLSEAKDEEPEWNIRMVNADEIADGNEKTDIDETVTGEAVYNVVEEGTSNPVKIAVMDSGIELLSGIPVEEIVNLVSDEQDLPYYMNDMTGHGTAVAGIINDIAPNAEIYSVKIMDAENKATLSRVVEGIYWCIENDIDIINMSFGTQTESQVLEKAIEDAHRAGILIVSSAGNGGRSGVEYPAAYEEVIAVGAVDTTAQKTEESAVGEEVELVAPGEEIISDSMLGLETVVSGTSMAAPHVTAAAAVLWQKDKTKSPDFIRGLLSQAANDLGDAEKYGNGLVDLEYALEHYEEYAMSYEEPMVEENTKTISDALSEEQLIKENTTSVETFEDVDYVEGRWGTDNHKLLVDNANNKLGDIALNQTQVKIFKNGAVYPDKHFVDPDKKENEGSVDEDSDDRSNKHWHGGAGGNYIANYIFATQMAYHAGNDEAYTLVKGHKKSKFNQMSQKVKLKKGVMQMDGSYIGWNALFSSMNCKYDALSDKNKIKRRRVFLYGMASHIITDTFAHSAYVKEGNGYRRLTHPNNEADNTGVVKQRFIDAQKAMNRVLRHLQNETIGEEIDFSPKKQDWGKSRNYYLRNVLSHAKTCQTVWTNKELEQAYSAINYTGSY